VTDAGAFYNGISYRDQYTARWAVFLDALDVGFRYDPAPDSAPSMSFWLTALAKWMVVSPEAPNPVLERNARSLAESSRKSVYAFFGPLAVPTDRTRSAFLYAAARDKKTDETGVDFDETYWWCECPICQSIGIEYEGRAARLPCRCVRLISRHNHREHNYDSPRLVSAYLQAQTARLGPHRLETDGE
jgi:hypothetical protein